MLYRLCRDHPFHTEAEVVLAKVLLIGRAYAASMERRKPGLAMPNGDFYLRRVAPSIMRSSIDHWIDKAKRQEPGTPEALALMREIHGRTTDLFSEISGLEKRSLASKYLHFHVPALFFIYDSRAVTGMRRVGHLIGRAKPYRGKGDYEYATFAEKCTRLSAYFSSECGYRLQPRELDNALLELSSK